MHWRYHRTPQQGANQDASPDGEERNTLCPAGGGKLLFQYSSSLPLLSLAGTSSSWPCPSSSHASRSRCLPNSSASSSEAGERISRRPRRLGPPAASSRSTRRRLNALQSTYLVPSPVVVPALNWGSRWQRRLCPWAHRPLLRHVEEQGRERGMDQDPPSRGGAERADPDVRLRRRRRGPRGVARHDPQSLAKLDRQPGPSAPQEPGEGIFTGILGRVSRALTRISRATARSYSPATR